MSFAIFLINFFLFSFIVVFGVSRGQIVSKPVFFFYVIFSLLQIIGMLAVATGH